MPESNSIAPAKPSKPSADFPLFPHATGRWAKKIRGQLHYFGPWDDPQGALARYESFAKDGGGKAPRKRRRDATHTEAPGKPSADFPLFPHATGRWAKKIKGKLVYFGPWDDPQGALESYLTGTKRPDTSKADTRATPDTPSKPYPEFPLFPHATKRWAKKIRGQLHYFGPWTDPDGALAKYLADKDSLHAGRTPRPDPDALTIKALANAFLSHKQDKQDAGELSPRTWAKYKDVADLVVQHFGRQRLVADLRPEDFASLKNAMGKTWGALRVRDFIQHIRSVFKFGYDAELMAAPMRFGPGFARPSKKTLRLERARKGPRMFEAEEIRRMLDAAGQPLHAMILLGINAGLGNADIGRLPLTAVNLESAWLNYARGKTGIGRRCPLWPETVEAIRAALAVRPEPKAEAGLLFITKYGLPWHKETDDSPVTKETRKLLDALGIDGHRGFYGLRHTLETIGGEAKDQVALDSIMGHAREDMASHYRERISDGRLLAVTGHVRAWVFGAAEGGAA
jgi:integrase